MVVVRKKGLQGPSYDFTVIKQKFMDALLYKIQNDPYYGDVQVDYDAVEAFTCKCNRYLTYA